MDFVYKKEKHLTMLEKLAGRYGDAWIWTAFDPVHKLVPAWRVGKRTLGDPAASPQFPSPLS